MTPAVIAVPNVEAEASTYLRNNTKSNSRLSSLSDCVTLDAVAGLAILLIQ
jgi:hypothetical protein